jgi:hypothetical protein
MMKEKKRENDPTKFFYSNASIPTLRIEEGQSEQEVLPIRVVYFYRKG